MKKNYLKMSLFLFAAIVIQTNCSAQTTDIVLRPKCNNLDTIVYTHKKPDLTPFAQNVHTTNLNKLDLAKIQNEYKIMNTVATSSPNINKTNMVKIQNEYKVTDNVSKIATKMPTASKSSIIKKIITMSKEEFDASSKFVNKLEDKVFGYEFKTVDIVHRIDALENQTFKKIYPSDTLNQRINRLNVAVFNNTDKKS